jgi:arginyl-tRNA synthetase
VTPADLSAAVLDAARAVRVECGLDPSVLPAAASVERPRNPDHGDYASAVALQVTSMAPRDLATAIAERLARTPGIKSVEVAGPGFLNVRLDPAAVGDIARIVVQAGREYGQSSAPPVSPPSEGDLHDVRYAHARAASLLRQARDLGLRRGGDYDPGLLVHERESDLLKTLGAAEWTTRYLAELADAYHAFQDTCRVLPQGDEPATELTRARLWLVEASRIVLANGLAWLGVSAPERM